MHILSVKKICLCYVCYLTIEIVFEINIVICHPQLFVVPKFLFRYFLRNPDIKKQNLGCEWACEIKKWLIIILKVLIKQSVLKQSLTFLSISFLIDCCISVFFCFLIKPFSNFEKLIRFHWQTFIGYKNGENLKILIEIFRPKLKVSSVILAFLDHMKPKIFFVCQPWLPI